MGSLGKTGLNPTLAGIAVVVQTGHPVMLRGQPGIGKTEIIRYLARMRERFLVDMIGSNREPTDFSGFPVLLEVTDPISGERDKTLVFAPPKWALDLNRHEKGVLFIDEYTQMPPATQNAAGRVYHDMEVGDLALTGDVWRVSAMNPPETTRGAFPLNATSANRFIHFSIPAGTREATLEYLDWEEAGRYPDLSEVRVHPGWRDATVRASATDLLIGFLRDNPDLLDKEPDGDSDAVQGAWPSRRSVFTFARDALAALKCARIGDDAAWGSLPQAVWSETVAGCAGADFSTKFFEWVRTSNVPSGEALLKKPETLAKAKLNGEPDVQEALRRVTQALLGTPDGKRTEARWDAFWSVLNLACDMGHPTHAAQQARTALTSAAWQTPSEGLVRHITYPLKNVRKPLAENLAAMGVAIPEGVVTVQGVGPAGDWRVGG